MMRKCRILASVFIVVATAIGTTSSNSMPAMGDENVPPVDVALVLVVDASPSIVAEEFQLQKEGIAEAITDPTVLSAIRAGRQQRIALAYVEWGSPGAAMTMVDWHMIDGLETAGEFTEALLMAPRSRQSWNAIGDGIDRAAQMFATCPCQPKRMVIDVSGDNPDANGVRPSQIARDDAVSQHIVINALAIIQDARLGPNGRPWLVEVYEREVIGGPAAFVVPANTRDDFTRALRDKLILEISGLNPDYVIQSANRE